MPELSLLPMTTLTLSPPETAPSPLAAAPATDFATTAVHSFWATPPGVPATEGWPLGHEEPCTIEGLNDRVFSGRLVLFDTRAGVLQVQVPPARSPMRLRFSQFRRLTLTQPVVPPASATEGLGPMPLDGDVDYHVRLDTGRLLTGRTLGHVENELGLFLFLPTDEAGKVLRCFCPRAGYKRVDFGPRLGEILVSNQRATPGQINAALQEQIRLRQQFIGEMLVDAQLVTQEQVDLALQAQRRTPNLRLGEILVASQGLAPDDLNRVLVQQMKNRAMPMGELLVRNGLISRDELEQALTQKRASYRYAQNSPALGDVLVRHNTATPAQITAALAQQEQLRSQRLGDVLLAQQVLTPDQLVAALEAQSRMPMVRIGEALISLGYISEQQLESALNSQGKERKLPLGELLVRQGLITRDDLGTALVRKMGYPRVDLGSFPIDSEALRKLKHSAAKRLEMLPLSLLPGRLVVAMEDPSQRDRIDEAEFLTQCKVVPVLPDKGNLAEIIQTLYTRHGLDEGATGPMHLDLNFPAQEGTETLLAALEHPAEAAGIEDEMTVEQSDSSLVRLLNSMIVDAHQQGVSDIHIETLPGREKVRVRFRVDGALQPYLELPHTYRQALIARLKIMCDLDISERRRPQDGKINFARFVPSCPIELRVAMIPTNNGLEDAVLRILASAKPIPLEKLGMSDYNRKALQAAVQRPYGLVLCVGPTGSGKTTTLHSALNFINTPDRKIWTAEDPVEITQAGLRQVQVNPKIDWTFAKALRSFLRADPDVIMVGEIRDSETAQIAVESSLTGHLVLSTLHTNSAAETVTRLLDMGMDPFNFADSLLAVLAQRLVRRVCSGCRTERAATAEEQEELLRDYLHVWHDHPHKPTREGVLNDWMQRFGSTDGRLRLYRGTGCELCKKTGLKGRAGVHELLTVSKTIRRLIQTGSRAEEIQIQAMGEGLRTLRQDGIEKVLAGVTTIEEVRATSNA